MILSALGFTHLSYCVDGVFYYSSPICKKQMQKKVQRQQNDASVFFVFCFGFFALM